ncbi:MULTISPECIES: hypothetical protein [Streptomyces]|uniref:Secreted protein n=1 Tax=Streptomyces triticiradicis TaxID=2651189 RepID=A0A7J5DKZ8_9ACTN|nr:hypothetical protein [Streptomyces triticiradicis]KAB1989387.1 hypothetical protein F8144_06960 [Streptomyces triticiradicis]
MRKLRTAAVLLAALGGIAFAGGTAQAAGGDNHIKVSQSAECKSHDLNLDVLGEVGVLNGLAGNLLNGEGNPGGQATSLGSKQGCNNSAF